MILLDLDDTLIDHTGAQRTAAVRFGQQYADRIPNYSADSYPDLWEKVSSVNFSAFARGEISFEEQRRRRLKTIFQEPNLPNTEADMIFKDHLVHYEASWSLFPDVIPFLEKHAEIRLAILTNGQQAQQEHKLQKTGIDGYFKFVISAESAGVAKPHPEIFVQACQRANLRPDQIRYIGDNLKKDAQAANEAGLKGIWLNRNGGECPNQIEQISSLTDFEYH